MFGDLIINWMDHQRSRFMADWNNDKGLVDFNSHPVKMYKRDLTRSSIILLTQRCSSYIKKPASSLTTKNGTFWFCGQKPSRKFICPDQDCYMYYESCSCFS